MYTYQVCGKDLECISLIMFLLEVYSLLKLKFYPCSVDSYAYCGFHAFLQSLQADARIVPLNRTWQPVADATLYSVYSMLGPAAHLA
jgi:hypothetical protein